MTQLQDPTISRIREARHIISERFGHDPRRILAYYLELQRKQHEKRITGSEKEGEWPQEDQGPTNASNGPA